jgi:hypothetical protein
MRCSVLLHVDEAGAERMQSNDRMLIESLIVAVAEAQSKDL